MKIKTIIVLILGIWLSATAAQATPVSQGSFSTEELAFAFQDDNIHFAQGDMMCSEEMKSTQGEWGFVGAFFSAFTYIAVNTIQGKPVTGKGIAQQAAMGFINPFTSGGPWSSYNPLPF